MLLELAAYLSYWNIEHSYELGDLHKHYDCA